MSYTLLTSVFCRSSAIHATRQYPIPVLFFRTVTAREIARRYMYPRGHYLQETLPIFKLSHAHLHANSFWPAGQPQ